MGSYDKSHTKNECDRCLKDVGVDNLKSLPFIYLDLNDKMHKNLGRGYRQYRCCKECYDLEVRIWKKNTH